MEIRERKMPRVPLFFTFLCKVTVTRNVKDLSPRCLMSVLGTSRFTLNYYNKI